MDRLVEYVRAATIVYRKGEVVHVDDGVAALSVVTIDAFPEQPEQRKVVDCHFVTVGFTEHAPTWTHHQFYDAILANSVGEFTTLDRLVFAGGPSYITVGSWIGDQTLAFQFMALGELHGLWKVVTPATLGITGPDADRMAGGGFVMVSGFTEPAERRVP